MGRGGRIEGGGGKSFPVLSRPTLSFALLQSSSKISACICASVFLSGVVHCFSLHVLTLAP